MTTETAETKTVNFLGFIPEPKLENFLARVDAAQRAAKRLGVAPIVCVTTGRVEYHAFGRPWVDDEGVTQRTIYAWVEYAITGDVPVLPGGWTLLAVVDRETAPPIVGVNPRSPFTVENLRQYFDADAGLCVHCSTKRKRRETFLVGTPAGEVKEVGRDCLADYLGCSAFAPSNLLAYFGFLAELTETCADDEDFDCGTGGRVQPVANVIETLTLTCAVIDVDGWVSKKAADEAIGGKRATVEGVRDILWPPHQPSEYFSKWRRRIRERAAAAADAYKAETAAAVAWARTLNGQSEYEQNLSALTYNDHVRSKHLGLLCSLIAAYRRAQEKLASTRADAAATKAEHVGEVKQRLTLTLKLLSKPWASEGQYGTTYLCRFADPEGRRFVWWASKDPSEEGQGYKPWAVDETREVKATIKRHSTNTKTGLPETVITRVS